MIAVHVHRVLGIALQPHDNHYFHEILEMLPRHSRVVFVDLVPTLEMVALVRALQCAGHTIYAYRDHHKENMHPDELYNIATLSQLLGDSFRFESRRQFPSCGRLVDRREWNDKKVDVVFFHADFDGFTALLYGCGLVYRRMLRDADIIDSGRHHDRVGLSRIGSLLLNALDAAPPYSVDPTKSHECTAAIFQLFIQWLIGGQQQPDKDQLTQYLQTLLHEARLSTQRLVAATTMLPGRVAWCDFTSVLREHNCIFPHRWTGVVAKKYNVKLFAYLTHGKLVCVELPKTSRHHIDLTKIAPMIALASRRSYAHRIWIAQKDWPEFLRAWRKYYLKKYCAGSQW